MIFIKSYHICSHPNNILQHVCIYLAGKAINRGSRRRGASTDEAEAGVGAGILKNVPPGIDAVGKGMARDVVVVSLCVVNRGDGLTSCWAGHGPAGLGDPDGLSLAGGDGDLVVVPEGCVGVGDAVGLCRFVVWVGVDADEVDGGDQGVLTRVGPDVVGVDMADGFVADDGSNLADVVDDGIWPNTNTGVTGNANWSDTIYIFRTNTDTSNQIGKPTTILRHSGLQSRNLVGELSITGGCPETEQQRSTGVDGSRDGRDGCVCGSILYHGI